MVREAPYDRNRLYDVMLEKIIIGKRKSLPLKDDDFFVLCVGDTGTGKSSLLMHAYELFDPEGCDARFIGLNNQDHARALNEARKKKELRFCAHDEANVTKRSSITRYNKAIIEVYFQIRGLQIFHWWNNPSADVIDKVFIKERLKGLIFIFTKDVDRSRLYYYFTKKDLLDLYDKFGNLDRKTLKDNAKKYAYYQGWFRAYKGKLLSEYLKKKDEKMNSSVSDFFEEWGEEKTYTQEELSKQLGVSRETIRRYKHKLAEDGTLVLGEDYKENVTGRFFFTSSALEKFRDFLSSMSV